MARYEEPQMVDPAALGALLGPALPYLLRAGDQVAVEAADSAARAARDLAGRAWERLSAVFRARPAAQKAAEAVADAPDDPVANERLVRRLGDILDEDPQLARELEPLVREWRASGGAVAYGDRSLANTGEIRDSVLILGDGNDVRSG